MKEGEFVVSLEYSAGRVGPTRCPGLDRPAEHRRLFAGLESLRRGWGSDRHVAQLLKLDAHTVGRGRRELFTWDLQLDQVRRPGGGP